MNTPAHAILNLVLLGRRERRHRVGPILAGAVLPDLPIFGFYLWQRLAMGLPEAQIWREVYFRESWQNLFDLFNSVPLVGTGLLVALASRSPRATFFFSSMLLHFAFDFPFHHDDAHRHFYPLSHFRFESPLSYWDPHHYGHWVALTELGAVLLGSLFLWRRFESRWARTLLAFLSFLYVGGYALVYGVYL